MYFSEILSILASVFSFFLGYLLFLIIDRHKEKSELENLFIRFISDIKSFNLYCKNTYTTFKENVPFYLCQAEKIIKLGIIILPDNIDKFYLSPEKERDLDILLITILNKYLISLNLNRTMKIEIAQGESELDENGLKI